MAYSYAAGVGESVKGICEPIVRLGASHADTIQKAELADFFGQMPQLFCFALVIRSSCAFLCFNKPLVAFMEKE